MVGGAAGGQEAVEAADRAVVAPLLRTLGNLAAAGDPPLLTSLLAAHQGPPQPPPAVSCTLCSLV